jgi:predicted dehydrogenase
MCTHMGTVPIRRAADDGEVKRMAKVRWGILSTANIGMTKVNPAIQKSEYCEIVAIASRDQQAAERAARQLGVAKAYGSYEALLADPEVDAVYNPLPNNLHVPWSIKALKAGKHVLCEKPIAPTSAEAQQLVDAALQHPHLKVMEAFMYRFHPQWQRTRELVRGGRLGELRTIQAGFSYYLTDPNNIRNLVQAGGGTLLDVGCYSISVARFLYDAEPRRTFGIVEYDPAMKTDRLVSAVLDFGSGTASFTCGTQLSPYQRVLVLGTKGQIELEIPFNAPPDQPCRIWYGPGFGPGETREEILLPVADQYTLQADAFARAILDDTPVPTPIEDSVANLRVIEAIVESSQRGQWV